MPLPLINYNLGVPNPPNNPSVDVTPMQQNTGFINQIIGVDHVPFNVQNSGAHLQVNFLETTSSGTPLFPPTVGGVGFETLYATTKASGGTFGTQGELYFTRGGSGTQIQLTGPGSPTTVPSGDTLGYTFLPGGILIQWGSSTKSSGGSVSFSPAFPNNIFAVYTTVFENNNNRHFVAVRTQSLGSFTVSSRDSSGSDESNTFNWLAIGN